MSRLQQLILALAILLSTCLGRSNGVDDVQTKTKGDNGTLACETASEDEQLVSAYWYKGNLLQAQMGATKDVTYPIPSLGGRLSMKADLSLLLTMLEVEDSGNFTCQLFVHNTTSGEMSNWTRSVELIVQDVPSSPSAAKVMDIQSQQVTVQWTSSATDNNSPIISYIIEIRECTKNEKSREEVVSGRTQSVAIKNLTPYTCYNFQVRARNSIGRSAPGLSSGDFYTEQEGVSFQIKTD